MQTSQFQLIKKLFDSEVSRQEFGETLKGIQNLIKEENPQYSPCVIAFGMIWEILPNRKKLTEDDVKFLLIFIQKQTANFYNRQFILLYSTVKMQSNIEIPY